MASQEHVTMQVADFLRMNNGNQEFSYDANSFLQVSSSHLLTSFFWCQTHMYTPLDWSEGETWGHAPHENKFV